MATGLGKGLEAIIPGWNEAGLNNDSKRILEIGTEKIKTGIYQPRKNFDEAKLQELAESIRQKGVIQPLVVVKAEDDFYNLIAGERRLRASILAGLKTVPVIVKEYGEEERLEIALIENLQREDLNSIEEAETYDLLIEKYNLTQDELSQRIQKSRPYITNTMRLLNLSETIKNYVRENKISSSKARTLLSVENEELREKLAVNVVQNDLSVKDIEEFIAKSNNPSQKTKKQKNLEIEAKIKEMKKIIKDKFKSKDIALNISLENDQLQGCIKINFNSYEDFEDRIKRLENLNF
jgi:ParB family chromosome partitioning protein